MDRSPLAATPRRRVAVVGLAFCWLSLCFLAVDLARACGPYAFEIHFANPRWPDDFDAYRAGELEVLGEHYDARLLWLAYRHLHGLSVPELENLALGFRYREGAWASASPDAGEQWSEARAGVPGFEKRSYGVYERQRSFVKQENGFEYYGYILNCLDDAFRTATRTLEARIEQFGLESKEVRAWLVGQDAVFENCDEGQHLPEALDESWPQPLRFDRQYQLAAAHLYSESYAEAETRFRAIADEAASPWSDTASYVVARALARQGRYGEAIEHLDRLLADPSRSDWHSAARGLRDHYRHQHEPQAMREVVAERLTAPEPPPTVDQDIEDLQWLLWLDTEPSDDLLAWLRTLGRASRSWDSADPQAIEGALERWWAGQGAHWWLAAAMIHAHPEHHGLPDAEPRSADRQRVERLLESVPTAEGPGRLSILYHRLRLEHRAGRLDTPENLALVESILAEDLGLSARNRFLGLYRHFADDLDIFLQRSFLQPVVGAYDDGSGIWPDGGPYEDPVSTRPALKRLFDPVGTRTLDQLSPERLFQLAEAEWLPQVHRARLARVAWAKAVLLERWQLVAEKAERVAELVPEVAGSVRATAQADRSSRPFVAALALLRDNAWEPFVHDAASWADDLDVYTTGYSWWCAGPLESIDRPAVGRVEPSRPPRPAHVPLSSIDPELGHGRVVSEAPVELSPEIFDFADAHPDDPRVPEALHRLVRATRYSCGRGTGRFGDPSREAFGRLHRQYPQSPWTAKTPYWFE